VLNVAVAEIILNEPGVGSLVGQGKATGMAQQWGWARKGRAAALLHVSRRRLTVER
jgi:hypothetical protein